MNGKGWGMKVATSALRLLYLEDNPVDADLTRRALARLAPQMRMEVVATLAAALELLTQADPPFDLVLADLNLPDGSGLDLLGHVRAHQLPLAVVILTGSGDQEAAVTALKAGADDYLVKRPEQFENLPRVLLAAFTSFQKNSDRCSKPLRVLYGDPNGYDVDLTFRYLTQHAPHIRMKSVGSGEEVLACLPPEGGALPAFDVLLLDYRLPCMNALQVVKVVRQERGLDLPIVLVTGHGTEDVAVRALRLGVDDYLVKHQGYLQKLPAVLEKAQRLAELNASEERYRALFEHNHAVMLVVDPESGEVVDANQSAATWYGWPRVELCRKNICEISTSPWHETLGEIELARIRRDWRFLRRHRKADGSLRDVEVLGGPITVAGRSLLYGIILDITDKHRAQQDLKKRESEFQHLSQEFNGLLDAIPDDLMLLDRDLKVLWANRAAAESIDVPAGELKGRSCYELFCNRTAPCTLCPPLQSFTSGTPHEETVTRIDGRTWDIRSVPLLDEQGRVEKVIELSPRSSGLPASSVCGSARTIPSFPTWTISSPAPSGPRI